MVKRKYRIGSDQACEIPIKKKDGANFHAEIYYERGQWILANADQYSNTYVNAIKVNGPIPLGKFDQINIGKTTIHWSDLLYEGENQELNIKDFKTFHGRISRSNYRALILLAIGSAICIFFIPGLLDAVLNYLHRRLRYFENIDRTSSIQLIAPIVYMVGYLSCLLFLLLISIKRVRDAGHSKWTLLIPFYNLYILLFKLSKP